MRNYWLVQKQKVEQQTWLKLFAEAVGVSYFFKIDIDDSRKVCQQQPIYQAELEEAKKVLADLVD